jgi:hypothetical protein
LTDVSATFTASVASTLSHHARAFPVPSEHISVIDTPAEFYATLHSLIADARHRVLLSALYLGAAPMEQALVAAVSSALAAVPALTAHLMFDYARGRRRDAAGGSSLSLCQTLVTEHPGRVSAAFFGPPLRHSIAPPITPPPHSSSSSSSAAAADANGDDFAVAAPAGERRRSWLWSRLQKHLPGRGNELLAVHHMKIYIADDTLVRTRFGEIVASLHLSWLVITAHLCIFRFLCFVQIISGANLSEVYFEQRQDRYLMIKDKPLCDALAATALCLSASPAAALVSVPPPLLTAAPAGAGALAPASASAYAFGPTTVTTAVDSLEPLGALSMPAPDFWFGGAWLAAAPALTASLQQQGRAAAFAAPGATARALQVILGPAPAAATAADTVADAAVSAGATTLVFPSVQLGSLSVRQDERLFSSLLSTLAAPAAAPYGVDLSLATGYFNVPPRYQTLLARLAAHARSSIRVIVASKEVRTPTRHFSSVCDHL